MNKNVGLGANSLIVSLLLCGFASYGKLKSTPDQDQTLDTLTKNWTDYTVYWTGLDTGEPTAIMFDPKSDDKALTGDRWYRVESRESLLKMIGWLKFNNLYYPSLWRMVGPDGELYGYIYTGYTRFTMKMVDERTMKVYGIPATLRGEAR